MAERDLIRARLFRGLVDRAGGVEAAAAILEEAYGACSKGTLSKMASGQARITVDAVRALEDSVGAFPITRRLFERIEAAPGRTACDLRALAARLSRGSGETVAALVMGFSDVSPDPQDLTAQERAEVNALARELRTACEAVIAETEYGGGATGSGIRSVG